MELRTSDRVLITGAAGGLGAAIAKAFHQRGAQLILTGRQREPLEALASEMSAKVILADLALPADVERLHAEAGDIDVAILNAGVSGTGSFLELAPHKLDQVLEVNLRAPMHSAQHYAKQMCQRKRGHIIFVSSIAGKVSAGGSGLYSATKFGLRGLAFGLREDLHGSGVGVTTIYPGFIRDAGLFAKSGVKLPKLVGTRSPEDCARAVLKALQKNPAEIDVASFEQRFGGKLFPLAPEFTGWLQRKLGASSVTKAMVANVPKP